MSRRFATLEWADILFADEGNDISHVGDAMATWPRFNQASTLLAMDRGSRDQPEPLKAVWSLALKRGEKGAPKDLPADAVYLLAKSDAFALARPAHKQTFPEQDGPRHEILAREYQAHLARIGWAVLVKWFGVPVKLK